MSDTPIRALVPMIHVRAAGVAAGEITYPDYLPHSEFRVRDPDGYTLMIAQSAADTP